MRNNIITSRYCFRHMATQLIVGVEGANVRNYLTFILNGKTQRVDNIAGDMTLLKWLESREKITSISFLLHLLVGQSSAKGSSWALWACLLGELLGYRAYGKRVFSMINLLRF